MLRPLTTDHRKINKDRDAYMRDPSLVQRYRDYVDGITLYKPTTKQLDMLSGITNNEEFSDNICWEIVSQAADRLEFQNWTCENQPTFDYLHTLYRTSQIETIQGDVHESALRDGNALVSVLWDDSRKSVVVTEEPWYNGVEGAFIQYDTQGNVQYVVKDWFEVINDTTVMRRMVWYNDRLERWASNDNGATWQPIKLEEDNGRWPVPWLDKDGVTPLRVPYVHFPNHGRGKPRYGKSELWGGVLTIQDELSDIALGIVAAVRQTAFQIYFGTGIDGSTNQYRVGAGEFWWAENEGATFGAIPAGSLKEILDAYNNRGDAAARISRTPRHVIGGTWPSGEAIMRSEQPSVGKARRQVSRFKSAWVYVGHKATTVANRFGNAGLETDPDKAIIGAVFADPERRDPVSNSTVANNLGDAVSPEEKLRIMGYPEDRITKVMEELDSQANKAAKRQQDIFAARGNAAGTPPEPNPPQPNNRQGRAGNPGGVNA